MSHAEAVEFEREAELIEATTSDGWRLAVHHWAADTSTPRAPVLMLHGLGANRLNIDLDERYSIARAAQRRGFPVYVAELRGHGMSRYVGAADPDPWGLDEHAEIDLPAIIKVVQQHSASEQIHGFGHSMGGFLFYRLATQSEHALRSIVTMGTPLVSEIGLGRWQRRMFRMAARLPPGAYLPFKRLMSWVGRVVPLSSRFVDGILLNLANTEPEVALRMSKEAIDDIPVRLILEIQQRMTDASAAGPYSYEDRLSHVRVPVFALAGTVDQIAPSGSVSAAVARMESCDVRFREVGLRHGDRADYGHIDIIVGRHAPDEIFPLVLDFFEEND